MKKQYIDPVTDIIAVELTTLLQESLEVYEESTEEEIAAPEAILSRGFPSLWDDEDDNS